MPHYYIIYGTLSLCTLVSSDILLAAVDNSVDTQLRSVTTAQGLTGNPFRNRNIPSINDPTVQLGKDLFFSKVLSGDNDTACVSCHHPLFGGGDDLSLPIGVGAVHPDLLGPGRVHDLSASASDGGPPVPRNAPTTFNILGWDSVLFHDGRLESLGKTPNMNGADGRGIRTPDSAHGVADPQAGRNLTQAQARFPVTSKEEMRGFNHDDKNNQQIRSFIVERIRASADANTWHAKFRTVFSGEPIINEQNISFALGEYERSQVFVNNPWKAYLEGNNQAISESAKQGALLFFRPVSQGGANCVSCHTGDFLTDEGFHNLGMPQIGRGKGDGDGYEDFGRFRETKNPQDMYAFRTPSLLNVAETGPWSHAGAYASLETVVKHHLNPQQALDTYDVSQLRSQTGVQGLDLMRERTQKALNSSNLAVRPQALSDQAVKSLVDFLHTLTDPCIIDADCLNPWIAEANGELGKIRAIDSNGNTLAGNTIGSHPVPLSPVGSGHNTTPGFSWRAVEGASSYLLWVNEYATPNVPGKINRVYTPGEVGCSAGGTCSVVPNVNFARADAEWWVSAIMPDGSRRESMGAYFNMR